MSYDVIPAEARPVLIRSILNLNPAHTAQEELRLAGVHRSKRAVVDWLRWTREHMGLPGCYPRADVAAYRQAVQDWIAAHPEEARGVLAPC